MNPLHPKVPVEIGGHSLFLRYEYRDFAKAEGRLDMALYGPPAAELFNSGRLAYITGLLLYVGLMNCEQRVIDAVYPMAHPTKRPKQMSLDDVLSLISHKNANEVETIVIAAFQQFIAQDEAQSETKAEVAETKAPLADTSGGSSCTPFAEPPSA